MRDRVHLIVWALLLLALTLRLIFVLTLPARALYWDEPHYEHWARAWEQGWSSLFGAADGTPLLAAFRGSLQKGEAYTATVGLLYLIGGGSRAVFVLQALLDTVTCLLLYGLARALGGVRAGLIALAFAALYETFIFSAARLQTETFASLLYVGGLWAICVPERRRSAGAFVGGILVALAMLAKPVLLFLFPALLPGVLVRSWDRPWRGRLAVAAVFAAGYFAVIGPRLILTKAVTGQALWSVAQEPSGDLYAGTILSNVGWFTDRRSFAEPAREELLAVLGGNPTRAPLPADFEAAVMRTWTLHPFQSIAVVLHKLYVAWLYPYNDSHWTFLTGRTVAATCHQLVLGLALVGMPLGLRRWKVGIPLLVATLYLWFTYVVTCIEVRYAVIAMPMMICFAGVALAFASAGWQRAWRAGRQRRLATLAAAAAVALAGALIVTTGRVLQVLPLGPDSAHAVRVAVILVAITVLACVAADLACDRSRRLTALARLAPSVAVAALIILFGRPLAQTWHEWQSTLRPNRGIAAQDFVLPAGIKPPLSTRLKLDLLPEGAGAFDVVVHVNGEEIKRYAGGPTRRDADLPTQDYYQQIFAAQRRELEPDKAWYTIALPPELISPGGRIAVEVQLEGEQGPGGSVAIFGDYPPGGSTYVGPSLISPAANVDTSLYQYLAEGDFRMRRRIPLSGASHSRFHDGSAWSDTDLGFDPGRQQGRYRIFLVLAYERSIVVL